MLPYWLLFGIVSWMALNERGGTGLSYKGWSVNWYFLLYFLILLIGLRHKVGGDWGSYLLKVNDQQNISLLQAFTISDPGYAVTNWFAVRSGFGIYFTNTVCASIFSFGLIEFCRMQPRPWLGAVVAVPYLIIVVAMGYTRQGTAIGFTMLAFVALQEKSTRNFILYIILASCFHKTAIILMPLIAVMRQDKMFINVLWSILFGFLLYAVFMESSIERLKMNYFEREMTSLGAGVRVAMNGFPAVFFILFRNSFGIPKEDKLFWIGVSIMSILFLFLVNILTSTTIIDRLALYLIPIQIYVFSRLPELFGERHSVGGIFVLCVIAYSAVVQFVWLFFATHSHWWLPYQFYPLVWLFE